jgi:hypothetical protein
MPLLWNFRPRGPGTKFVCFKVCVPQTVFRRKTSARVPVIRALHQTNAVQLSIDLATPESGHTTP